MEETFLDSVSRWLGYIALTWVSYLIYLASGLSVTECVAALLNSKKTEAPHIQVIPATPSTPDKTFETFELPQASAESTSNATAMTKKAEPVEDILREGGFVLDAPNRKPKNVEITDHPTDDVTSECTESFAAPETSAVAAAASATSAVLANAASIAPATQLCDPMCDPTTRFNVTRCSFSVEKLQTLPSIKILTPEDVCPPGTLISGLPESGNDDSSDSDPSPTNICRASDQHSTNLTDHHSPQRSNSDEGASPAGRRTGGDDLLVKMLCDIDQVEACHDLRKPRPSIDEPLLASDAAVTLFGFERQQQQADPQRRNHEKLNKQVSWDSGPGKAVRFSLPGSDTADCSDDSCSEGRDDDDDDGNFHESPDSDDEDSEGSPTTQRKTPSRGTPHATQLNAGSPLYESLLKDLSDETLDESTARIDTATVLDALLFQNKRRRSLPTVQTPGGDYEMVYREKLERQSLGDSLLTETSLTPQKFKASLKEEDFADLLPPLSPDCGYDSLSEVVSSPDEFDCYGSAQQLSVIVEEPLEEDKNPVLKKEAMIQNGNSTTTLAPAANLISTENAKHEAVDVKASSVLNRNHSLAPTEDFDSFTTMDNSASFLRAARAGNLEKVLEYLKGSIDINTSNANGLNALHLASKEGHVLVVKELLQRGAEVNAATKKGNTALHIASLAGQADVVQVLVEKGANVNVQSQNGFTPLYMAAQENHDPVVRFLLANNANQSLATEDGFTPLAVALQQGHDKVVAVLLENDAKGKVRLPALHIAAKKDDTKAAALLLQNEHNPDVTSKSGFTPLHIAAHYGNAAIAAQLLDKGADVNFPAKHQISPLHVAAKWGKTNMVKLLLDKGACLDASTRDGLTPLHCAARSGHDQVVDQLIDKGAPITAKTKNGLAPLHMASQGDHVESAKILLNHKAPVDDITVDYLTALHVAAHCGHVGVAKLLLDKKADANSRALNGFTPLHIACKKNRIKVVELLLRHGASIEATTESGLTPLHVASFMGCMNIVIYLIQHGANADVPTVRGETPLHLAARANQTDIVRILLRNGAQVDTRAREQQTPLHIAARLGNVDIVGLLLQHGANVDSATKDLYTSLHIAAKEGQEEVVNLLLDHGASVTAATKKGFTPLHLAAKYGHLKVGKLLLQRDAPVDAQGKNGVTPLHVAAHYDYNNIALLLLERGGSPHAAAKNGYTPLHIAAKKNQMDIGTTLLEYGAKTNAESKAGFTSLHLAAQEGFADHAALLIEHGANVNAAAKNGLTPLHLCAQEDKVNVAAVLAKYNCQIDPKTAAGYTPLHVACHFGQTNMIKFLLQHGADVNAATTQGYTPLHQAAQQGHALIINLLLENRAQPNATTKQGQTALSIAEKLGYISVIETLKVVTETTVTTTTTVVTEEKYKVVAPETMHETFMSDSEDEAEQDNMMGDHSFKYLTADEMKSLGDDSLPIDVTRDEKAHEAHVAHIAQQAGHIAPSAVEEDRLSPSHLDSSFAKAAPDNVEVKRTPVHAGFLVSFMVDARGGAMRGCRHSGVRVIIPPRRATMPMRVTCRFIRKEKLSHPPPLMEGEACAARVIEMGPAGAKFLGPVVIEVPHFASLRGKEREIVILRSDNGETWKEHTLEATEDAVSEVLNGSFDAQELNAMQDFNTSRVTRILTTDFPQFFAVVCRNRQEVHSIGPEGGMVSSTVVSQVQAIFPDGALTKKIKVGLQAQPIHTDMVTRLLGNRVAVSPIVTVEPRRRKFHKPITLTIPLPKAAHKGMTNQYQTESPTLRLLCSITGGQTKAQWEDVTGSTPLTFVSECVSFTTTVSARFWLIDCRQVTDVTKFATELYHEAVLVPFMAKFVVFAKRHELLEAQLRVFCMTDDREDKTLENQEHFAEVAKSRDVEVLEGTEQYLEFAGNLVPITKSGEQLALTFEAFKENRVSFNARVKDMHQEPMGRVAFMKDPRGKHQDVPQTPVCNLNIRLPEPMEYESVPLEKKYGFVQQGGAGGTHEMIHRADLHLSDIAKEVGNDWAALAGQLGIPVQEIQQIRDEVTSDKDNQALTMLKIWIQRMGPAANGNALEKALQNIGRDDIVHKCMSNIEVVTDDVEKAVAKVHLSGPGSITSVTKTTVITTSSTDERDIMKDAESAEDTSSGSARTKPTATPAPVEVHEVHQTTVDVKHADSKKEKTPESRKEKLPEKPKADSKKKDEPKKEDSKKQSPKREIPPPPKKEPPKKEKKEDPPKKDAAASKKDAKKESMKKKEEPKKEASPAPPKKETSPPKKEPSPAPPKKEASPPKKEAKKEEAKKTDPAPKKDSPKKEAPRKEDKKIKSPSAAPPEPPKKAEERREQAAVVSEAVVTEVIQKTEVPSTASPQKKKREGTPVDELSAELLEQIVRDDQDLALKGGAPKKAARDVVDAGPGGVMGRNVDIERYIKETTPEEIVIPEYRHETRTVTMTSMTTTVTREGVIGELGAALKDFDDGGDRQGPIITEIGDAEAALLTEQQIQQELQQQPLAPQQRPRQEVQSMSSPEPSAFVQESHEVLPDGTLQHTITKVTTTTFVQEEGQPPVELSTRLHESEAGASDADTSQVSVSSLPEDEGTVSSGLQHMQESLLMGDIMTAAESHTGIQTSVTTRTITEVDYDSEGNPHEKTVTITTTRKVTTDTDGQQHVEETETRS